MFPKGSNQILGMNARNQIFLRLNARAGRRIADSKILTKRVLTKNGLPTPGLLKVFRNVRDIFEFDWITLPDNFVLKPVSGYGGGGIIIVKKKAKWAGQWRLMDESIIDVSSLRHQALDILAGQYSLHNLPDWAMIEERVKISKVFRKFTYQGTPDIRVIVFNKVPVMAMLRLPTAASHGKANLHQGAIGVGIDMATGITTYGIWQGKFLKYIPGTKRKINGLKLPRWTEILTLAVKAQEAVPSLGYVGVDIVFDKEHGPVILELNCRPGLEIQNANSSPLRKRLERVSGLDVVSADHGVRIAKTLFAERFADRVMAEEGIKTIGVWEEVKIRLSQDEKVPVRAKIDTGAWKSSIDKDLAREMGLLKASNVLWTKTYKGSLGQEKRQVINLCFYLAGRKIETIASVANREKLRTPLIIGRRDLEGFIIKPGRI